MMPLGPGETMRTSLTLSLGFTYWTCNVLFQASINSKVLVLVFVAATMYGPFQPLRKLGLNCEVESFVTGFLNNQTILNLSVSFAKVVMPSRVINFVSRQ